MNEDPNFVKIREAWLRHAREAVTLRQKEDALNQGKFSEHLCNVIAEHPGAVSLTLNAQEGGWEVTGALMSWAGRHYIVLAPDTDPDGCQSLVRFSVTIPDSLSKMVSP